MVRTPSNRIWYFDLDWDWTRLDWKMRCHKPRAHHLTKQLRYGFWLTKVKEPDFAFLLQTRQRSLDQCWEWTWYASRTAIETFWWGQTASKIASVWYIFVSHQYSLQRFKSFSHLFIWAPPTIFPAPNSLWPASLLLNYYLFTSMYVIAYRTNIYSTLVKYTIAK